MNLIGVQDRKRSWDFVQPDSFSSPFITYNDAHMELKIALNSDEV